VVAPAGGHGSGGVGGGDGLPGVVAGRVPPQGSFFLDRGHGDAAAAGEEVDCVAGRGRGRPDARGRRGGGRCDGFRGEVLKVSGLIQAWERLNALAPARIETRSMLLSTGSRGRSSPPKTKASAPRAEKAWDERRSRSLSARRCHVAVKVVMIRPVSALSYVEQGTDVNSEDLGLNQLSP
jgi:hypothetical protein